MCMQVTIVWCTWNHKSNIIFKNAMMNGDEKIFGGTTKNMSMSNNMLKIC